jgi:hypothetical protein
LFFFEEEEEELKQRNAYDTEATSRSSVEFEEGTTGISESVGNESYSSSELCIKFITCTVAGMMIL